MVFHVGGQHELYSALAPLNNWADGSSGAVFNHLLIPLASIRRLRRRVCQEDCSISRGHPFMDDFRLMCADGVGLSEMEGREQGCHGDGESIKSGCA